MAGHAEKEGIFVVGGSGHAKVVLDAIERQGMFEVISLVDDNPDLEGRLFCGLRITGGKQTLLASNEASRPNRGVIAVGDNAARRNISVWLAEHGFGFVTVTHPAATIGRGVELGAGTVVMAGVVINSDSRVGDHVILNTGATVDHDCTIGAFVHVAPGAHLCGGVTVDRDSFICAGATVVPNLRIGRGVVIGAGSTVLRDVPDGVVACGSPAETKRALD